MKRERISIKKRIEKKIEFRRQGLAFIEKGRKKMDDLDEIRNRKPTAPSLTRDQIRLAERIGSQTELDKQDIEINFNSPQKKTYIFNQYAGIGDILFIEPIIRKCFQNGHPVVLPVLNQLLNLQPYFPYIKFVDMNSMDIDYGERKIIENEDTIIIPLRFSTPLMSNKYKMVDMDFNEWRTLTWLRHRYKEENLKKILKIKAGEEYNLINESFGTNYPFNKRNIVVENDHKNIVMTPIKGYTLLDWSGIIENASTIHTVNTSILYLLEVLKLSTSDIHVYSRNENGYDFKKIDYLFNLKYVKHN